jgi:hypothetical protein
MWQMSDNSMKTFKESFEKINMNEAIKWYYKGKFEEEDDEKENDIFIRHGNIWPDILCVLKNKNKFGPTEELYIWRVDKRHDIFDEIPHCWGLYQKIGGVSKLATKEDIEKFLDADKLEAVNNY